MPDQYLTSTDDFEAVLAEAPTVLAVTDEELTIRFVSPAIERVLGYDMESLVGRTAGSVHPADKIVSSTHLPASVRMTGLSTGSGTPMATGSGRNHRLIRHRDRPRCLVVHLPDVSDRPRFEAGSPFGRNL